SPTVLLSAQAFLLQAITQQLHLFSLVSPYIEDCLSAPPHGGALSSPPPSLIDFRFASRYAYFYRVFSFSPSTLRGVESFSRGFYPYIINYKFCLSCAHQGKVLAPRICASRETTHG